MWSQGLKPRLELVSGMHCGGWSGPAVVRFRRGMILLSLGSGLMLAGLELVFSHKLLLFVLPHILNLDKRFSPNVDSHMEYFSNPF